MPQSFATRGIGRVAIVGVGAVGSTTAYAMLQAGTAKELLLVDTDRRRAEGELLDLGHSLPFAAAARMTAVEIEEACDCDLVVVTAGVAQRPGETRLELVRRNIEIFRSFFPRLSNNNPEAIFLIITNPVDVMTRVALELSGLPPNRVLGSGTMLDTGRFRHLVSQHCRIHPRNVHAHVLGEHGDSEVLVWSRVRIGPFVLGEFCKMRGLPFDADVRARIDGDVRDAAYQIIERKGATHFAIGVATVRLAEALAHPIDSIYTVSCQLSGQYGISGVCLSLPTIVSRDGAGPPLEVEVDEVERQALVHSAEVLDAVFHDAWTKGY